jgi:hypothetical protein
LTHFEFEENLQDSVGDNDGTEKGGVMAYAEGIAGRYAVDPGGSAYAELPLTAYPRAGFGNGLDTFTYAVWVKRGAYPAGQPFGCLFGSYNSGSNKSVHLAVTHAGGIDFYMRQDGGIACSASTPAGTLSETEWHHIALTYDGAAVCVYVDGILRGTDPTDFPFTHFSDWQTPMVLMARNVRGSIEDRYPGQADDLRIYNTAISREDAARLYYDVTDIRQCIYNLTFDVSGPGGVQDCVVDFYDLAEFAADWLSSGIFQPDNGLDLY